MRFSAVLLLPAIPAAVGCAGTVSDGESLDADAKTTTSAVVTVERTTDVAQGARAEASARFLRVTGPASADDALRAIGAGLDLPAVGTCAAISSLAGVSGADQAPMIELIDVGAVSLEANGVETRLSPRQLPDVTDVVSGVVYARATDPTLLPAGAGYVVHIGGPAGTTAVDVSALAPSDPADVRIASEDDTGRLVASGSSVDLSWASQGTDDVIYVDVQPNGVRCVFGDTGRASVSTVFMDDAGTLVIHRLHRQALGGSDGIGALGVDSGQIRFDFARAVPYTRR